MGRLINLKFIVTASAMGLVQHALYIKGIDSNVYSVLMSLAVGGFMALEFLSNKVSQ